MYKPPPIIAALFSLFVLFFSSCSDYERVVLLSDNTDALIIAEIFNSEHENIKITVNIHEDLERAVSDEVPFDIIAGRGLNSRETATSFRILNEVPFFDNLYSELLPEPDDILLLPLSFSLPVVAFKQEQGEGLESEMVITHGELLRLSKAFNKVKSEELSHQGFSPLWSDEYLYLELLSHRCGIYVDETMTYENDNIEGTLKELLFVINENNGGLERELKFNGKYRYIPDNKLLQQGRIGFSFFSLDEYITLSQEERLGLDFRYLLLKRALYVTGTTHIALAKESRKESLESILNWIYNPDNQTKFLEYKQARRMDDFGFFDGFSTLPSVNDQAFSLFFPEVRDRIPENRLLKGEDFYLPHNWIRIKTQVIIPWIREQIVNGSSESLEENYQNWLFHTVSD